MSEPISRILTSLKVDKIIPDVIPSSYNFTPSVLFSIVLSGKELGLGEKILCDMTKDEPELKIQPLLAPSTYAQDTAGTANAMGDDVKYTLVMTDPDAPSREDPKWGQWRHWVATGIQLPAINAAETEAVYASKTRPAATPYYPPAPPPGSGFHRYVFLLFREPVGGIIIPTDAVEHKGDVKARAKWNAIEFGERHKLKLVGVNYFSTQVNK